MLSFNSWNAHAVTLCPVHGESYMDIPLTKTGVHKEVQRVSVVVRATRKDGFKVVLVTDPEEANKFRATLDLGHAADVLTLPSRTISFDEGTKMCISKELSGPVELVYEGPFDPIETSIFVVGSHGCVRVTCYDEHQVKLTMPNASHCQISDCGEVCDVPSTLEETTAALTKALGKKRGRVAAARR